VRLQHQSTAGSEGCSQLPVTAVHSGASLGRREEVGRCEQKGFRGSLEPGFCPGAGGVLLPGLPWEMKLWLVGCSALELSLLTRSCWTCCPAGLGVLLHSLLRHEEEVGERNRVSS